MPNKEEIPSETKVIKTESSILTKPKHTLKLNREPKKQKKTTTNKQKRKSMSQTK